MNGRVVISNLEKRNKSLDEQTISSPSKDECCSRIWPPDGRHNSVLRTPLKEKKTQCPSFRIECSKTKMIQDVFSDSERDIGDLNLKVRRSYPQREKLIRESHFPADIV